MGLAAELCSAMLWSMHLKIGDLPNPVAPTVITKKWLLVMAQLGAELLSSRCITGPNS